MKIKLPILFCILSEIAQAQGAWTQKANFGGAARRNAVGFSIGTKGYIGTGAVFYDFWEWDQTTNTWTQKADFGGGFRAVAVGFSIGTKGYIGTGVDGTNNNRQDFWEWNQATNIWTQKTNFGGTIRQGAVGFSIGTKGYIGTGSNIATPFDDFWEWNQTTGAWTQKANFGGTARTRAVGFSIGTKGYIGTGSPYTNDFWEWDQATNTWTQKANFGGTARRQAVGFSIGTKGYIGTGNDGSTVKQDFWEWDQATNTWTQKANFGGTARLDGIGFSIGNKGYIGTGMDADSSRSDFWEFNSCENITASITPSGSTTFCQGNNVTLTASTGSSYLWSSNATTQSIVVSSSGNYSVTVTDANGCSASTMVNLQVNPLPSVNITGNATICAGNADTLIASGGNTYLWTTGSTSSSIIVSITTNSCYTVTGTDANGCTNSDSICVTVLPAPATPTITANMTALASNSSTGNQWYLNGNPISGATGQFYNVTQNGFYVVCITDANGCSACSPPYNFTTTDIAENNLNNAFILSPNPNDGTFTIQSKEKISSLVISNLFGEKIYQSEIKNQNSEIDLSNHPSGIYFIHIKTNEGTVNKKLILQK